MHPSALRCSLALAVLFLAAHAHAFATKCLNPNTTRKYTPCEIDGTLSDPPANPYTDIEVWANFSHPTGGTYKVYGFLLSTGSSVTYRFRFNPMTEGTWSYSFGSSNPNSTITLAPGTFNVGTSPKESGFPRRDNFGGAPDRIVYDCAYDGAGQCPVETTPFFSPSTNGFDHPFFWGQTYYQIINNAATRNSAGVQNLTWQTAITSSKAKGFRKIRMLVFPFNATFNGSYVINGLTTAPAQSLPYETPSGACSPDYNRINLTHFSTLDQIVNYMHTNGMVAELILFHDKSSGHCGSTFSTDADLNKPTADDVRYAKYVVARYAAYSNVTFSMANEWETGPYTADQWDVLAEATRPYDPFRVHPRTGNLRLMTIHGHERVSPNPSFNVASGAGIGWMVHSSLQWSQFGSNNYPGSTKPPDQWGEEIRLANGSARPSIDDEFGYLENFDGLVGPRVNHRMAMWGLAIAGVYGSVGDTRNDVFDPAQPSVTRDLTMRSEWKDRNEWNDYFRMAKFFSDQAAQVPIPEHWRIRRLPNIWNDPARQAWLSGYSNRYLVLYDAVGRYGSYNITFTLPALGVAEVFDIWKYDPTTGAYTLVGTQNGSSVLTIDRNLEFTYDTVFLIKARAISG